MLQLHSSATLLELFQLWAGLPFHKNNDSGGGKRSAAISDLDKQSNCQILETENLLQRSRQPKTGLDSECGARF